MKNIRILIIILLVSGPLISQTYQKDSSIIANKDLKKAAILIDRGRECAENLRREQKKLTEAVTEISIKDSLISNQQGLIISKDLKIINYKAVNEADQKIIKIKDDRIADLHKYMKCQRKRTWFATAVATVAIVLLVSK